MIEDYKIINNVDEALFNNENLSEKTIASLTNETSKEKIPIIQKLDEDKIDYEVMRVANLLQVQELTKKLELEQIKSRLMQEQLQKYQQIASLYASLNMPATTPFFTIDNMVLQKQSAITNPPIVNPIVHESKRVIEKNPHLDKLILDFGDLKDIIAWALDEISEQPELYEQLRTERIQTSPDSVATKVISMLGELFYGNNRFIGPSKVGMTGETDLITAVTSVPVESDADARARAHDIGVSVSDLSHVDTILPMAAEQLQVMRPLFVPKVSNTRGKIGVTNKSLLKLAGDIEPNPGPELDTNILNVFSSYLLMILILSGDVEMNPGPREGENRIPKVFPFTENTAQAALDNIILNPNVSSSYVNITPGASFYNLQGRLTSRGYVTMRSGSDNQTDYSLANCNWAQVGGYSTMGGANGDATRMSGRLCDHAWSNRMARKDAIPYGELGTSLSKALGDFPDFTAAERTNTNSVSGGALLQLFSRIPTVDFGDYINLAKLLCYATLANEYVLSGTVMDTWVGDCASYINDYSQKVSESLYPSSINEDFVAGITPIEAYAVTQETYASMLIGKFFTPWNNMNEDEVAIIPIDQSWDANAVALITMCHLEFPFFGMNIANSGQTNMVTAANYTVTQTPVWLDPLWMRHSRVQGPRFKVLYIMGSNSGADLSVGNLQVAFFDPLNVIPATSLGPALVAYIDQSLLRLDTSPIISAFDYFSRFSTMPDYRAAVLFAGSLMQRKNPYLIHQLVLNNATPLVQLGPTAPSWNANIPVRNISPTLGRSAQYQTAIMKVPTYNQFFGVDYVSQGVASGAGARPAVPLTATYQNNVGLTRYAQYIGILAKKTISGTNITSLFKGNMVAILFSVWDASDYCMDIIGEWLIENGITNHQLHYQPAVALTKRNAIWTKIADMWMQWQNTYTGLNFYKLQMPSFSTVVAGDSANYFNMASWFVGPCVVTNRHLFDDFMEFDLQPSIRLLDTTLGICEWASVPGVTANPTGQITGGVGAMVMKRSIMFDEVKDPITKAPIEVAKRGPKLIYARAQAQHLSNNNVYHQWATPNLVQRQNALIYTLRPSIMYCTDFLRFHGNVNTLTYREGGRISIGMSLPVFPTDYAPDTGHQLLIVFTQDADANGPRPCMSLDGSGTYQYGTLPNTTSSQAYVPMANPF